MSEPILSDGFLSRLADLDRRLRALEASPQLTSASIKDGALTIFDSNGKAILVLGKQGDNRFGLRVNNASGIEVIRIGEQSDAKYNLSVFDAAGTRKVRVGELATGHGVEAIDTAGNTVTLEKLSFGVAAAQITTLEATTSLGIFQDLATVGPSVIVTVGTSGKMIVFPASACNVSSGGGIGFAGFAISGATVVAATEADATFIGIGSTANFVKHAATTGILVSGLNAGSHTVTMKYKSTQNNHTFYNRTLVVLPF